MTDTDGAGWTLSWHDEFDGPAGAFPDASIWTADLGGGGWGNEELQTYTDEPRNVALDGRGHLVVSARADEGPEGLRWTSARLTTSGKRAAGPGLFQVRARVPSGTGIWPAAWTLGQDIDQVGWPRCGEIDLIEAVGETTTALQTVHGGHPDSTHWQRSVATEVARPLAESFHTYSALWSERSVTFAVDDRVTGVVTAQEACGTDAWPFTGPQFVLLNVAVGGTLPGPPDASTPRVAALTVDWVRVFRPSDG